MFEVIYLDDNYLKHYCIAKDFSELKFILDRFTEVKYQQVKAA